MKHFFWRLKKTMSSYIFNTGHKHCLGTCSSVQGDAASCLSRKRSPRCMLYVVTLCMLCVTLWKVIASRDPDINVGVLSNGGVIKAVYKCSFENKDGSVDIVFNIPNQGLNSLLHSYLHLNATSVAKEEKLGPNATTETKQHVKSHYPISLDADYVINAPYVCQIGRPVDYLIIVHSATAYSARRRVIRETFGAQKLFGTIVQRVVFLLGLTKDPVATRSIQEEAFLHRDIVQGQFLDSYHNLTHKGILGFKWITEFCKNAKIIIKIDDDLFVNPFKLVKDVLPLFINKTRHIACHLRRSGTSPILRGRSKWLVHEDEFKGLRYFPFNYCNGYFVIITTDLILPMLKAARINPFFWIDDVYLFGMLPATIGSVKFVDIRASLTLRFEIGNKCYHDNGSNCKYLAVGQWLLHRSEQLWYMVVSNLTTDVVRELRVFGRY